jgi:CO/xanthine dehydrogenase Mo-binding subunit
MVPSAVHYLDGDDPEENPIGVKGLGALVQIGVLPAIANTVIHATARRIREWTIEAPALSPSTGTLLVLRYNESRR